MLKNKLRFLVLLFLTINHSCWAFFISGKITDSSNNFTIIFSQMDRIRNETIELKKNSVKNDGQFIIKYDIKKSGLYLLNNQKVFISPKDSLYIEISNGRITKAIFNFPGNYLYHSKFSKDFFSEETNLLELSKELDNYELSKKQELEIFAEKFPISNSFLKFMIWEFAYEKNLNLQRFFRKNRIDITERLKYINPVYFDTNSDPSPQYYYSQLYTYYHLKDTYELGDTQVSWCNFQTKIESDQLITDKEFILLQLFKDILTKLPSLEDYKIIQERIIPKISSVSILEEVDRLNLGYIKQKTKIPESVMHQTFLNSKGDSLTFDTLLNQYKDKVILVDFWAKWCGACIMEFPHIKKLEEKYSKNHDFMTLGISLDDTPEIWHEAMKKYYPEKLNQVFLGADRMPFLNDYFQLQSIPQYFLITKENKIINMAPYRPQYPKFAEKIDKYLE
jgi:thiol-disulfide isomerase/thioredoxin